VDEASDHGAIEPMGKDEQLLRDAVRNAREQCQCTTLLVVEAWFSRRRPHTHGTI
jgi:hypothetical protein